MNLKQLSLYVTVKEDEMEQAYLSLKAGKINLKFFLRYMDIIKSEALEVVRFSKHYLDEDSRKCDELRKRLITTYRYYIERI